MANAEHFSFEELAEIFHEFKQPLSVIKSWVELAQMRTQTDPETQRMLSIIADSTEKLWQQVMGFMETSAMLRGVAVQSQAFDLGLTVQDALMPFAAMAAQRGISIHFTPPVVSVRVMAEEAGVHSIISNLVSNGIKYNRQGGRLMVALTLHGGMAVLAIHDEGEGIPAADQPMIFLPLYRAGTVKYQTEGTGLGLALVKRLVERYKGRIWFKSDAGNGTTFYCELPLAPGDVPAPEELSDGIADQWQEGHDLHALTQDRDDSPTH